jgi:hypothetical protein
MSLCPGSACPFCTIESVISCIIVSSSTGAIAITFYFGNAPQYWCCGALELEIKYIGTRSGGLFVLVRYEHVFFFTAVVRSVVRRSTRLSRLAMRGGRGRTTRRSPASVGRERQPPRGVTVPAAAIPSRRVPHPSGGRCARRAAGGGYGRRSMRRPDSPPSGTAACGRGVATAGPPAAVAARDQQPFGFSFFLLM